MASVCEIWPVGMHSRPRDGVWITALASLLAGGGLLAVNQSWETFQFRLLPLILTAVVGMICCGCVQRWKRYSALRLLPLLPWLGVLLLPGSPWNGMKQWFNDLISRWNTSHDGVVILFPVQDSGTDALLFSILLALLCGELAWTLVAQRKLASIGWIGFLLTLAQLLGGTFSPMSCALYLGGFLGMWMLDGGWSQQTGVLSAVCTGLLCLTALFTPDTELQTVTQLRQTLLQDFHDLRYGADVLPLGNLFQASRLNESSDEMLTVRTQQVKSLYLRGFVGASYADGTFLPLSNGAYGGDWAGMLDWLEEQNFSPLTQSADYQRLSGEQNLPESNGVTVETLHASRYYVYAPSSLEMLHQARVSEERDVRLVSKTLLGAQQYRFDELSSVRPSELTTAASWVGSPVTAAQAQYCQAEAVYREFVYQIYTAVDADLAPLIQSLFWEDDESTDNSLYHAVSRVRETLRAQVHYTRFPENVPEEEDPIRWFLTESRQGNAVLYTAAAVEAFRAKGIPARYVEGYYLPSSSVVGRGDTAITLTGRNAHAWVELYFDGVGWLPVDVTPGYYYNTIALQQMVGKPSASRKTAALEKDPTAAKEILGGSGEGLYTPPVHSGERWNLPRLLLGVVSIVLLLGSWLCFLLALVYAVTRFRVDWAYHRADPQKRVAMIQRYLFLILQRWGYEASLGWRTDQVDAELSQRIPSVKRGEYSRVCALLEKTAYGGQPLEQFEERTLIRFLRKIDASEERQLRRKPWKLWHSRNGNRLTDLFRAEPPRKREK